LNELGLDAHGLAVYFGKANPQAERDLSSDGRALYRRLLEESSRAILTEWARLAKGFDWKINATYLEQNADFALELAKIIGILEARSVQDKAKPPLQLLPQANYFLGREVELAKLLADLKPGAVAEVCGPGGMGKTALAAEAICRLTENGTEAPKDFPDGVVVHLFYKQADVNLAFEHIVRSYGGEAKPTPAIAAQELLARKQALLVLDGAEQADNLEALLAVRRADHQQEERGEGDPAGFTAAGGSRSGGAAERLGRGMGCG